VKLITTATELTALQALLKKENPASILGFVPTMGALHDGHMSLIKTAKSVSDRVICSIFVNPTQFNDPRDLERYPRTIETDKKMLEENGCDYLFVPTVNEVYPNGTDAAYSIDFEGLDELMEGKFRPGHFKGVAMVVERLFDLVRPEMAFFGRKDFQQVAIIHQMVKVRNLKVKIKVVETLRNQEGLALSSRNALLSQQEKIDALIVFKTLSMARELAKTVKSTEVLRSQLIALFNSGKLTLEYLEIVDDRTLQPIETIQENCTCCIAAFCGNVRLIDNMAL
jgi:pantoate--beta-alanine ligase